MTFGWFITEFVEVGHAHDRVIRLVVRGKVATYRHHHGKPDQIFRKLLFELLLVLLQEESLVTSLAN